MFLKKRGVGYVVGLPWRCTAVKSHVRARVVSCGLYRYVCEENSTCSITVSGLTFTKALSQESGQEKMNGLER